MKDKNQGKKAKRILVINDEQELLDLFRALLEEEGHEVFLFSSAFEDIRKVEQVKPDLIILDILLGSQQNTGWTILQNLKFVRTTASIPIIICTAALREVEEQQGYLTNKGVSVVFKPFDIDDLLNAVEKALA
jgi:DNA-binding response OmpR family regulator